MRSLLVAAPLVAAVVWTAWHVAPGNADAAEPPPATVQPNEIESVALEAPGLPVPELRTAIASQVGKQLDDGTLAHDREALREALVARGYLAARVGDTISYDDARGAYITFSLAAGPLYRVRSVKLVGLTAQQAGVVTVGTGDTVEPDRIARARTAIADRLVARGDRRTVTARVVADPAAAVVDVELAAR